MPARDRHPYRPLPVVPRVHDDLPVGRQLHAPRRSCAGAISRSITAGRSAERLLRRAARRGADRGRRCSAWRCRRHASRGRSRACCRAACARCWRWRRGAVPPPSPIDRPQIFPAEGERRMRVALLPGCAQQVLAPEINEATIRLLTRHGCEVVVARAAAAAARSSTISGRRRRRSPSPAPISMPGSASGSPAGSTRSSSTPRAAARRSRITALCCARTRPMPRRRRGSRRSPATSPRSSQLARPADRPKRRNAGLRVAYHSACSLQHGQQLHREPKALLAAAGFEAVDVPEGHLCCGSAGTYNLLQPELADALRDRKLANIALTGADLVAAGNIGCITQLAPAAPCRSCTRSSCSTGRPAALSRSRAPACGPAPRNRRDQQRQRQRRKPRSPSACTPIGAARSKLLAGGAEIDARDRQRQLAEQRAQRVGAEPQRRQPERVIGQAVRDHRHQPHHGDHAPAAALDAIERRPRCAAYRLRSIKTGME